MVSVPSPCSSPPRASTMARVDSRHPALLAGRRRRRADRRVQRLDHLVGDVVLRVDVDASCRIRSYFSCFGHLLDDAVGAVEHLLQFLVLARVQVFLEFAALALEVAVLVDQAALPLTALAFRQRRALRARTSRKRPSAPSPMSVSSFSRFRELLLPAWPAPPWPVGLAEDAVGVDETDAEIFLCLRLGAEQRAQPQESPGS
jgi:hypothetical protein